MFIYTVEVGGEVRGRGEQDKGVYLHREGGGEVRGREKQENALIYAEKEMASEIHKS